MCPFDRKCCTEGSVEEESVEEEKVVFLIHLRAIYTS